MNIKYLYVSFVAVIVILAACLVTSCDEMFNAEKGVEYDPSKPVVLSSFFPDSGRIRTRVIIQGDNFGSDPSKIKVYFNQREAAVVGSDGSQMFVIVPRVAEDIMCDVSVVVGGDSVVFQKQFSYNVTVTVSTVVGNGTQTNRMGPLESALIAPFQMDVDGEGNIFVGVESGFEFGSNEVGFVRINETENVMELIQNMGWISGDGYGPRFEGITADKRTGMLYTSIRQNTQSFVTIDPADGWIPRSKLFRWVDNPNFPVTNYPPSGGNYMGYNQFDGFLYTHYGNGQVARIDPNTAEGMIIGIIPSGTSIGIDFDPNNPEMCYIAGYNGAVQFGIYRFNVNDPTNTWERLNTALGSGYRDGPIHQALFGRPYGLRFDPDGIMYISDLDNHCIRKYNPATERVELVLGIPGEIGFKDGGREEALFNNPSAVGIDVDGNVYVVDRRNRRIRKLAIE